MNFEDREKVYSQFNIKDKLPKKMSQKNSQKIKRLEQWLKDSQKSDLKVLGLIK